MSARVRAAVGAAANELARVRFDVTVADTGALDQSRSQMFLAVRAMAYVRASAVLEAFTKAALGAVLVELDALNLARRDVRLSLMAILHHGTFEGMRDVTSMKRWGRRVELLLQIDEPAPATFGMSSFAVSNRTLRGEHFDVIWQLFGFDGPSLPAPVQRYRLALHDLAERRNDLAHGDEAPLNVARTKTTQEALRMLEEVENVVEHLGVAAEAYLTSGAYRR